MRVRTWAIFALFLFIVPSTLAIGLSPAIVKLDYKPNHEYQMSFTAIGATKITTYLKGDLAPYAEIIDPAQGTGPRSFDVILRIPADLSPPGERILLVGAIEEAPTGSTVAARAAYQAPVKLFVPYPGIYIESDFHAPSVNVNEPVNFSIAVRNRGTDTVPFLNTKITVIDAANGETRTILNGERTSVPGGDARSFLLGWDTTGQMPGPYIADAEITYGAEKITHHQDFRIGTQFIRVVNFTRTVTTGAITPFEILLRSEWNTQFNDVYAEVSINGANIKTPTVDMEPWQSANVLGYWDVTNVAPGVYPATVTVHYGEDLTKASGDVTVTERTVIETPTSLTFTTRISIALVILLTGLLFLFVRRRKK